MSAQLVTIIVGLVITIPAILAMWIYSKNMDKKKARKYGGEDPETSSSKKKKTNVKAEASGRESIEKKVGIDKINSNIIFGKDGSMSVVIEYSTPDIGSLKDDEIERYEDALRMTGISLKHELKVIEYAGGIKTVSANRKLAETLNRGILNDETVQYALQLSNKLSEMQYDLKEVVKRKFVIVSANENNKEETLKKLKKRVEIIITNLDRAKTKCTLLDTTTNIDVLNEILSNGNSRLDIDTAEKTGTFELFSSGTARRT